MELCATVHHAVTTTKLRIAMQLFPPCSQRWMAIAGTPVLTTERLVAIIHPSADAHHLLLGLWNHK